MDSPPINCDLLVKLDSSDIPSENNVENAEFEIKTERMMVMRSIIRGKNPQLFHWHLPS